MKNKLVLSLSNTIGIRIFINEYLDVDYVDENRITHHSMIKYLIEKGYKLPTRVSFDSVKEIDIETGKYLAVMEETKKKKKGKILIYENPKRLNMNKLYVFGHTKPDTDSIASAIVFARLQKALGIDAVAYKLGEVNKETKYALKTFEVEEPQTLTSVDENCDVALVDNNEFSQSVSGIEKAHVKMVVDHHKIKLETVEPIYFITEPLGCTCTILYKLYKQNEVDIDSQTAGLMLSAIISDTLLLKSPTTTDKDKKAVEELAKIANVDISKYGLDMLKAGTDLDKYTEDELIRLDAKCIEKEEIKYVIAQVNTVSIPDVLKRKAKIEEEMNKEILAKGLSLFAFVITDIVNSNSEAIVLGDRTELISKSYEIDDDIAVMPGVVSRKKQILPLIEKNM